MRYLILFAFLLTGPLMAETIGNVEYDLPKEKAQWQKVTTLEPTEQQTTYFYIPEGESLDTSKEFFGVHVNNLPSADMDEASLKAELEKQFEMPITLVIVEKTPTSVLYEWGMDTENGFLFSLNKVFFSDEGTTLLFYQTTSAKRVDAEKGLWLESLRNAKEL